jgi:CDP-diacylglycerol--serine O-phosphatidyltransferase
LTRANPGIGRRRPGDRRFVLFFGSMADFDTQRALQKNRIRRRGIYLLPNLFTTAALFAGFYAIVQAMNLRFDQAAVAIFVAMVLDGLDGRVARLTRTQSAFGAEYDSLSDVVSFGAAPALIVYEWALKGMGKLGWIAAFVYVAGAALRLARFNTMLEVADKHWFTGLPSPAAAALVAGFVWIVDDYGIDPSTLKWWVWCVTVFAGLTMVSNVPFYSFKAINLKKSVPFLAVFVFVLVIALLSYQPAIVLFGGFVAYALSGYVMWAWRLIALRRRRSASPPLQ